MKKTYEVKFLTKRGGERWWVFYTEADNAKVARCIVEEAWQSKHEAHMFNIKVRVAKLDGDIEHGKFMGVNG
jgi:hypothetical protein